MGKLVKTSIIVISVVILLIIIMFISMYFFTDEKVDLNINWGINIPKPNKVEVIYNYKYRDGEDFEIWYYKEDDVKRIINNNSFKAIDEQNKNFIQKNIEDYYKIIDEDKKELFNSNVNIESLLIKENYYAYAKHKDDENSWILLILDYKMGKLYYFTDIY